MKPAQLELVPYVPTVQGVPLFAVRLDGKPQRSKHHPCVIFRNGKPTATTRPDKGWDAWRAEMRSELALLWYGKDPIRVPVIAGVTAVFPRIDSARLTYTTGGVTLAYPWAWTSGRVPYIGTPDHDQVTKAALDVLVQGGVLADDPLVVGYAGGIRRWYAAEGERPCVEVRLWAA
jgi:Holliday junction resolvase RusA-like endonuclease